MDKKLHINKINNRQYILSPAIQSGNDRESTNKDFYQEGNEFCEIGKLGLGMKVVHRKTQIPYTIIHFEKAKVSHAKLQKKLNSTLDLMYKASHPYLFRLLNHYETETHVFMIFESYDGDSLDNRILKGKCDLQNSLKYFVEVMLAVQHMHSFNLYNLNVNPENILVTECVKLTDYGLKMAGRNEKPKRDTRYKKKGNLNYIINAYTTPEELNTILNGTPSLLNGKTDSWNCGILLYEMLTGFKSPFKGETDDKFIEAILNCDIDLSLIKDDFCRDIISKLVKKNPKDRIDIDEVLNMEYIKNVDIEQPEIDFSDNIINPIDEKEFLKNTEMQISNEKNEEMNKEMNNLKSENDNLKKMVEDLRKKMRSSMTKQRAEKIKNRKLLKHTQLKSMVLDKEAEIIAENENVEHTTNLAELLEAEEEEEKNDDKIDEKNEENNEEKNEEKKVEEENNIEEDEYDDDDFDADMNGEEDDIKEENLFIKCEKYKDRNLYLKTKLAKIYKKNKKLKEDLNKYKTENEKLTSEKNENILQTLEKINQTPIYEVNDLVNIILNSINIFKDSQDKFKKSIEKLISLSEEQKNFLLQENKQYIDNKTKIFFDTLNGLNSSLNSTVNNSENNNQNNNTNKSEKENEKEIGKANKEVEKYKIKYEDAIKKEGLLLEKIKLQEENQKSMKELSDTLMKNQTETDLQFNKMLEKIKKLETTINDAKTFIDDNCKDKDAVKTFYKTTNI